MFPFRLFAGRTGKGNESERVAEGSITLYAPDFDRFAAVASTRKRQNSADILGLDAESDRANMSPTRGVPHRHH